VVWAQERIYINIFIPSQALSGKERERGERARFATSVSLPVLLGEKYQTKSEIV